MHHPAFRLAPGLLLPAFLLLACSQDNPVSPEPSAKEAAGTVSELPADSAENILVAEWTGPYGGVPAFDQMRLEDIEPAMTRAIELALARLDEIAGQTEAATFANTIVPLEAAHREVDRFEVFWGIWKSNLSTPEFRAIEQQLAPVLANYESAVWSHAGVFQRIRAIYEGDEFASLGADQQRLVWYLFDRFSGNGARLQGAERDRFLAINQRLSELQTQFAANVLADEEGYVVYLDQNQLGGLPASVLAAAAQAAEERGQPGRWAVVNTRSSMDPFLTFSDQRGLREQVWRNFYSRGNNGDGNDNNAIVTEILQLRRERSQLLGYENFAQWQIQNRMARTPEAAMQLLRSVWGPAIARVAEEVADMQALADVEADKAGTERITIQPWDYRYYAEKVRQQRYALDSDEVKQYLELNQLREAMFFVAGELFGFEFEPVPDGSVPVFHPDVKVWEVTDRDSGEHIGLWYLDPFARTGKRSGAWATAYRDHETFDGKRTVLSANNSNFTQPAPGQPVLISWDDAETFFHEFGHALHYLSSNVAYPTLNLGVRDYTEFQSQLLERWLLTDRVIDQFLRHHQTGEPMPPDLIERIRLAKTFSEGFKTTEAQASAIIDLELHLADPDGLDPQAFERETLARLEMPAEVVMRHRTTHFTHIFSGESYAAGYYGYLWAEVLTSDAAEAFAEAPGGFYDPDMAKRLVDYLFAPRNALDPAEAYRLFRGRDASIDALLRDRGFAP